MKLLQLVIPITVLVLLSACQTTSPTPTPPFGLPPLTLPSDESPHNYLAEWWYFNAHLENEEKGTFALHDVIFQVQEPSSNRTMYVRQVGLSTPEQDHFTSERIRATSSIPTFAPGNFDFTIGDSKMQGTQGRHYFLSGTVNKYKYELKLTATTSPLLHGGGILDYEDAGITYYYTRPRLDIEGFLTLASGEKIKVDGLGWLDKQWGDFQPVAVEWDWASIQLNDGTDLMISLLYNRNGEPIENYATIRKAGQDPKFLTRDQFIFKSGNEEWQSPKTGTFYRTEWYLDIPSEKLQLTLISLNQTSEFTGNLLPVTYWESGVKVLNRVNGESIGQGFVELNWAPGRNR
ncbi:MAG: hypothetical protein MK127_02160 [Dehalococcoidia bacterium]|nr:hypothetical protein [Dehalococcoidia bacterium]